MHGKWRVRAFRYKKEEEVEVEAEEEEEEPSEVHTWLVKRLSPGATGVCELESNSKKMRKIQTKTRNWCGHTPPHTQRAQALVLFYKNAKLKKRNKCGLCCQVVAPIVIVCKSHRHAAFYSPA